MDNDEGNTERNPVLDYYKKYSQNKNLSKYFRGTNEFKNNVSLTDELAKNVCVTERNNMGAFSGSNESLKHVKEDELLLGINNKNTDDCIDVDIHIELDQNNSYDRQCKVIDAQTETEADNIRILSPTSSLTSNRKLEWDNGADIGYANISDKNLHKSLSLPTLNTLPKVVSHQQIIRQSPDGKPAESSQTNKIICNLIDTTSESSFDYDIDKKNLSTTTSSYRKSPSYTTTTRSSSSARECVIESASSSNEQDEDQVAITLYQEKRRPLAESTPHSNLSNRRESIVPSTIDSKSYKQSKNRKQDTAAGSSTDSDMSKDELIQLKGHSKDLKLCVSKPIVVECYAEIQSRNKEIQTTLPHNISACIQTENINNDDIKVIEKIDYNNPNYVERQNVIFAVHSGKTDEEGEITQSNSFEFIAGDQLNDAEEVPDENTKKDTKVSEEEPTTPTNNVNDVPELNNIHKNASDQQSSVDSPLCNLMLKKQSNDLIQDLENSIELLQQVLKSQTHDETTKKKYIRKIAKKIIENKYYDDSSSSSINASINNDHLRNREVLEQLQKNVPWKPIEIANFNNKKYERNETSNGLTDQLVGSRKIEKRQELPSTSKDIHEVSQSIDRTKSNGERNKNNEPELQVPVEINDVITIDGDIEKSKEELIQPTYEKVNKPRHALFTMTSSHLPEPTKLSSDNNTINSERSTINEMHVSSAYSSTKKTSNSSDNSIGAGKSWRDDKTLSEKLLEEKVIKFNETCGDNKDVSLNFNKFKKENQLNWINNEINHLHNLRKILEGNQEDIRKALLDKPYDTMEINPKPTSVYVLTTQQQPKPNECIDNKTKTCNKATQYATDIDMRIGYKNYTLKRSPCCKCKKHFCNCITVDKIGTSENKPEITPPATNSNGPSTAASNKPDTDKSECGSTKFCKKCKGICTRPTCSVNNAKSCSNYSETDTNEKRKKDVAKSAEYEVVKKPHEPLVIVLKINKNDKDDDYPKSSTTSSSTYTTTTTADKMFCRSCKKCFTKTSSSLLNEFLSDVNNLCPRCNTIDTNKNYVCQQHQISNCYTCVNMKTINDIKNTIKDLDDLERQESMCNCKYELSKNSRGCPLCKRKKPKGIAYTLNLVPEDFKKTAKRKQKERKKSLESFTIKIPYQTLNGKTKCIPCDDSDDDTDESKENRKWKEKRKERATRRKRKSCTLQV